MEKWISLLLCNTSSNMSAAPSISALPVVPHLAPSKIGQDLEDLLNRLNSTEFYNQALNELSEMIEKNPLLDLSSEICRLSPGLNEKVAADLLEIKKKKNLKAQSYNLSEMQLKIALMKQKHNIDTQSSGIGNNLKLGEQIGKSDSKDFASLQSRIQKFTKNK